MIDLLYSYRRRNIALKDVKVHISNYVAALKEMTGITFFDSYIASFDFDNGKLEDLISAVRAEMRDIMYRCTLTRDGTNVATSKSFGEISKLILSRYNSDRVNRGGLDAWYPMNYAKWVFTCLDDMFSCIVVNGSISNVEYVGYRTKQYLDTLGLSKNPKRFGTPCDRNAVPISFYNGSFSLSSPPMTRAVHKKERIEQIYKFFGYENFYEINIGKTMFARSVNFRESPTPLVPIDEYKKNCSLIRDYKDVNTSFVYDLFCCIYILRLTTQVVNEDLVFSMFPSTYSGVISYDDNYFSKLKVQSDTISLSELITLVY